MKIILDAGHGYETPGKRSPDGFREYEFNRQAAHYCRKLLEQTGFTVMDCHSDEWDIPLSERTAMANRWKADCYISIHANAFGTGWNSANGIETYVHTSRPAEAVKLAHSIQTQLVKETGLANRGVKAANFHVLRETRMTAILIECGFMTNKKECGLLKSKEYQQLCGETIGRAILSLYKPEGRLYRVQAGAFSQLKNAESLTEKLRENGVPAYITYS
jgi:N-acetylmuramoyl-L-alanine amidase